MATGFKAVTYEDYISAFNTQDMRKFPSWALMESIRDISEFFYNKLGLSDDFDMSILKLIVEHARQRQSIIVNFHSLSKTLAIKTGKGVSHVKLAENLRRFISHLEKKGYCLSEKDGDQIKNSVLIEESFDPLDESFATIRKKIEGINQKYARMIETVDYSEPFPRLSDHDVGNLPEHIAVKFDPVKFEPFENNEPQFEENSVIQLEFPNYSSFHITPVYYKQLFEICVSKVKFYLNKVGNLKEQVLVLLNKNLKENNREELDKNYFNNMLDEYEFKSPLSREHLNWVRVTTLLQNIRKRKEEFTDLYQSAFLVTQYMKNEILKSKHEKESSEKSEEARKEKEKDFDKIIKDTNEERKPFTNRFISGLKDHKGEKILREKYTDDKYNDFIKEFIEKKIKQTDKPSLVHFEVQLTTYFIHIDNLISYLSSQIDLIPRKFLAEFRLSLSQDIKNNNLENRPLFDDEEYLPFLVNYVNENFPTLKVLLTKQDAIFLAYKNANRFLQSMAKDWFIDPDSPKLKSLPYLLNLSREYVFKYALHQLSILYWWGPYRRFMAWLRRRKLQKAGLLKPEPDIEISNQIEEIPAVPFVRSKKAGTGPGSTPEKAEKAEKAEKVGQEVPTKTKKRSEAKTYREKMKAIRSKAVKLRETIFKDESPETLLREYESIWNKNLREKAGKDTRNNVNDAIDSYVHRTLMSKLPLDYSFLSDISKKLTKNKNFDNIHKQDSKKMEALSKYIEAYMFINYIKPKYKI